MKKQATAFAENFAEAGAACMIAMVQGNLLVMTVSHLAIATQTGVVAGLATAAALAIAKTENRIAIAVILGVITTVVDYFIHPPTIESALGEAVLTGLGAAVLSFLVGTWLQRRRSRRDAATTDSANNP